MGRPRVLLVLFLAAVCGGAHALDSALFEAVRAGDPDAVRRLIQSGSSVNDRNDDGDTPLVVAVAERNTEVVRLLLGSGADIDAKGRHGWTALMQAVQVSPPYGARWEIEEILSEAGEAFWESLSWRDDGWCGAVVPSEQSGASIMHLLRTIGLSEGDPGDVRVTHNEDRSIALEWNMEVAEPYVAPAALLIEAGADLRAVDEEGWTAAWHAMRAGSLQVVRMLFAAGADPNERLPTSATPLMWAAADQPIGILQLLIGLGADVNARDAAGGTALHRAVSLAGSAEATRALLEAGAEVDARREDGSTPLEVACQYNAQDTQEIASLLLDAGADPNLRLPDGATILLWAARTGYGRLVSHLLRVGADANAEDSQGCTALYYAVVEGGGRYESPADHAETAALLMDRSRVIDRLWPDGNTLLTYSIEYGYPELARLLLSRGADVNLRPTGGWTPLIDACSAGHTDLVRMILGRGGDVNAAASDGMTALQAARDAGNAEIVSLLLESGANTEGHAP